MKLKFEPYVLEPFNDFYVFPTKKELTKLECLAIDYRQRLAERQRYNQQLIANAMRDHHQAIADLQRDFYSRMEELNVY